MTALAQQMNETAIAHRLNQLAADLLLAAKASDLTEVGRVEHSLRSTVVAMVGGASFTDHGAEARIELLENVLDAVRDAARLLSSRIEEGGAQSRGNLAYLATDRRREPV